MTLTLDKAALKRYDQLLANYSNAENRLVDAMEANVGVEEAFNARDAALEAQNAFEALYPDLDAQVTALFESYEE